MSLNVPSPRTGPGTQEVIFESFLTGQRHFELLGNPKRKRGNAVAKIASLTLRITSCPRQLFRIRGKYALCNNSPTICWRKAALSS